MQKLRILTLSMVCFLGVANAAQKSTRKGIAPPLFSTPVEACILPASQRHGVNAYVLRAILKIESNLNPKASLSNKNKSVDLGIGQMNSIHFKSLGQYGIAPGHLSDACVGTYVAAWQLKRMMAKYGNTWFGVAAYHSATPYFNRRYQILLQNELVRSGVMQAEILPVPSIEQ